MFTGLVETTGTLASAARRGPGSRLEVASGLGPLSMGESIAVNGACLTVAAITDDGFFADVTLETLEKTSLGDVAVGGRVNLERSVALGDRLGGHLVTGHVDGIAVVRSTTAVGEATRVTIEAPEHLAKFIAAKGSVALDGVSLTVNAVDGATFEIMLIPHTQEVTTLGAIAAGARLNIEVDLVARYVARLLEAGHLGDEPSSDERLAAALKKAGRV